MPEIQHSQFVDYLEKPGALKDGAVYLIQGEPMLVAQCVGPLIDRLLDGASREMGVEVLDGAVENIPDVLEQLNTYTLMAEAKVVWFKEAKLFDSGGSHQRLADQIQQAFESGDMDRAGKGFISLCAKLGVDPSEIAKGYALPAALHPVQQALGDDDMRGLIDHCQVKGWGGTAATDYIQILEQAVEKGFPQHHYLVITATERVPKNRKLYKTIQSHGVAVDCHVPLGERRADKMAQEVVLRRIWDTALQKAGKRMHPALFINLTQLTGFDPATFRDNLDKLIDFAGGRDEIAVADIEQVLKRTKSDPVYELTNAVADCDAASALFFLNTLMQANYHPLQILAAITNQMRKLTVAKDFVTGTHGRAWRAGMPYPQFQKAVMPSIQAFDAEVQAQVAMWQAQASSASSGKEKKGGKKESVELALAPNPGNAYPVYQTILKADNFSAKELALNMAHLSDTDTRLKTSGQDAGLLIKRLVMTICGTARKTA